jgi:hypothetical protein
MNELMIYFEPVGVAAGSRWDKRISLSPYEESPYTAIAAITLRWKKVDPSAPTKVRIFGIENEPIELDDKDLVVRGYLFEDQKRACI